MADLPKDAPVFSLPTHEAIFWRGVFIHRYSGVEHCVTEMLLRLGAHPQYKSFGKLPYPWPKKLSRLGAMLNAPGPLASYASEIREHLVPLTSVERHRHTLVHGMMSWNPKKDNPRMLFLKTHDWMGKEAGEVTMWITIDDLIGMTQDIGPIAQGFTQLTARIFKELDLAPIEVGDRIDLPSTPRPF